MSDIHTMVTTSVPPAEISSEQFFEELKGKLLQNGLNPIDESRTTSETERKKLLFPTVVHIHSNSCVENADQNGRKSSDSASNASNDRCSSCGLCCGGSWFRKADSTSTSDPSREPPTKNVHVPAYSEGLISGLFVHVCIAKQQEPGNIIGERYISEITFLRHGDTDSATKYIDEIANSYTSPVHIKRETTGDTTPQPLSNTFSLFVKTIEYSSNSSNNDVECSRNNLNINIHSRIEQIVFHQNYSDNIKRFLNYCDNKKAFKLEKTELEAALLTLIELFREQYDKTLEKSDKFKLVHLTYYDLLIPDSRDFTWDYDDCKLIFSDTLVEYISIQCFLANVNCSTNSDEKKSLEMFEECMCRFEECLKRTLGNSINICSKDHSRGTEKLICEAVLLYISDYICPPVTWIYYLIKKMCCPPKTEKHTCCCCQDSNLSQLCKKNWRIIIMEILIFFCWLSLILAFVCWILYYKFSVPSFEVNELEVYEPLAWIISVINILQACKISQDYLDLSKKNNSVRKAYGKAWLHLLEAKARPLTFVSTNPNEKTCRKPLINAQRWHQILYGESVTKSLTENKSNIVCERFKISRCDLIWFCVIFAISIVIGAAHAFIPSVSRRIAENESIIHIYGDISCIRISYILFSVTFYPLLIGMMMVSIKRYGSKYSVLRKLFYSTDLMQKVDSETSYFFNLREPKNLEYFLSLVQSVKRDVDPYHIFLSTMGCALIINLLLVATIAIYVLIYGNSFDLLTFWCCVDVVTLSIGIVIFLAIVVLINKLLIHDLIKNLRDLKKRTMTSQVIYDNQYDNQDRNIYYLDLIIGHIESQCDEYAVKLLGFTVDQKLVIKILISIATGIASTLVSYIKKR